MLVRTLDSVIGTPFDVDWGNGTSRRLIVAADGRGYALTETHVRPGTETHLRFDNHLEACYCVQGSGRVRTADRVWDVNVGTVYSADKSEEHWLFSDDGMVLICVFNPPLRGDESHSSDPDKASGY